LGAVAHLWEERPVGPPDPDGAIGFPGQAEAAFVHPMVVVAAQEHEVGQRGGAAEVVEGDVVGIAPVDRRIAPGEHAAVVSFPQGSTLRRGGGARR